MYKKACCFIENNKILSTENFDIKELEKGFSVYETVKITKGIPLFIEDHLKRLKKSADIKKVKIPISDNEILNQIKKLTEINKIYEGRMKFAVRYFNEDIKFFYFFLEPVIITEKDYKKGIKIISAREERENPNAKIINYDLRTRIKKIISRNDIFEVLLYNKNGFITECSKSNIFFVKDNTVYTPKSKDVLCGITRKYVFKICKSENIKISETNIKLKDISRYNSAFITGTSPGILPVSNIDNTFFNPNNNITDLISRKYKEITDEYLKTHKTDRN